MKIALVKVYEIDGPADEGMLQAFQKYIRAQEPSSTFDIFRPIKGAQNLPRPDDYDLVVITGGLVNLLKPPFDPWVDNVLALIRTISGSQTKLLGICWGHQAVAFALSGELGSYEAPCIGVQEITVTPEGAQFFNKDKLKITKFHSRIVQKPGAGFKSLAEDNEILLSESGRILTFQGHPEISGELSVQLFDGSYEYYSKSLKGQAEIERYYAATSNSEEDADLMFDRIATWAKS